MGAGASPGVAAAVSVASASEVQETVAGLPKDQREKLAVALAELELKKQLPFDSKRCDQHLVLSEDGFFVSDTPSGAGVNDKRVVVASMGCSKGIHQWSFVLRSAGTGFENGDGGFSWGITKGSGEEKYEEDETGELRKPYKQLSGKRTWEVDDHGTFSCNGIVVGAFTGDLDWETGDGSPKLPDTIRNDGDVVECFLDCDVGTFSMKLNGKEPADGEASHTGRKPDQRDPIFTELLLDGEAFFPFVQFWGNHCNGKVEMIR
eukprot:gnl/TRDRNA2_/TRDRNA2_163243_c1_seq5.p1 gnl/TRDRNA2_/TRDRNA2_163243_c1~~gnl/TRDRNA2_/TRDRNA2_163243_c1_seq5.p1  ORF type:complete len:262 (+),score=51.49 gnl/TRDRNA2_/TRDRNA2_163243_c1_seq5:86-871(+)